MKILFFSDLHLHLFGAFAANKDTEENTRFQAICNVLKQIKDYAITNKIEIVVVNGDIFETKNVVECHVNNTFWDWCVSLSNEGIKVILNIGNHDIASLGNENQTLLYPYRDIPNVEVIDRPKIFAQESKLMQGFANLCVVPFRRKKQTVATILQEMVAEMRANPETYKGNSDPANILVYHGAVIGAKLKGTECNDEKNAVRPEYLFKDYFDIIILGHFHIRQKLTDNIYYTGSPLHHDMGDTGNQKGFYVLDIRNGKMEFVPTKYPEFREIIIDTKDDLRKCNSLDTYHYYTIRNRARDVSPKELKFSSHNIRVKNEIDEGSLTRIEDIRVDTDINTIIDKYVELKNTEGLIKSELKFIGKEYTSEAQK